MIITPLFSLSLSLSLSIYIYIYNYQNSFFRLSHPVSPERRVAKKKRKDKKMLLLE
jgi:hypothetical protein